MTMKRARRTYKVALKSAGNPDHGQLLGEGLLSPTIELTCFSILECQRAAIRYRDSYDLGGGNWTGGAVTCKGKVVGRISYNGRFWPGPAASGSQE